jgi:hypothetical protein
MKSKKSEQDLGNQLEGILVSYVLSQDEIEERLIDLKKYLRIKGIKIDTEKLKNTVHNTKDVIESREYNNRLKALLFTKESKARDYQFGSDFCPKCNMFKNYEKECPYCGYLELTRR